MKTGRNDPCHCGSGKKFKHCHGMAIDVSTSRQVAARPAESRQATISLVQRGLQQHQTGNLEGAKALYGQVLDLDPDNPDAIHFLGFIAYQNGDLESAVAAMRRSIKLNPGASQYQGNLGMVLLRQGKLDDAQVAFERSLALDAGNAESHNNLGSLWQILGRFDLARGCFERALALRPGYADALNNLGASLAEMRCFDEAAVLHERVLAKDPGNADAQYFLGFVRFNQGRMAEGWRGYDWRLDQRLNPKYRVKLRPFPATKWEGQNLSGHTLLVHVEQGIGDQVWAAGMYDGLQPCVEAGARVVIECAPKLLPLYRRSFPWAEVVPRTNPPDSRCLQGVDFQISCGSLGKILRPDLTSFPQRKETGGAYLIADNGRQSHWKDRMEVLGPDLKVGLCWRSSNISGERGVKCPALEHWSRVLGTEGVQFVNLQYDECEVELAQAEAKHGVRVLRHAEVDMFNDLDETAALMLSLDLVISAPTAVAILSAALGVPTWELNSGTEWQCFGVADNPMYPTMRNRIKRWDQAWGDMLDTVAHDLTSLTRTHETMRACG